MKCKVVLLIAQGRSGSTLMLRVLNALPNTNIGGETGGAWTHLRHFYRTMTDAVGKGGPRTKTGFQTHAFPAWYAPFRSEEILNGIRDLFYRSYCTDPDIKTIGVKEIVYGQDQDYEEFEKEMDFFRLLFPDLLIIFNVRDTAALMESGWWKNWQNRDACRLFIDSTRANFTRYHESHRECSYMFEYEWWKESPEKVLQLIDKVAPDGDKGDAWKRVLLEYKDFY